MFNQGHDKRTLRLEPEYKIHAAKHLLRLLQVEGTKGKGNEKTRPYD